MIVNETNRTELAWLLTGQIGEHEPVRSVRIDCSPFRVGRGTNCSLSIPRSTVSSAHAEFALCEESLTVRDLGSTNGTFVNGMRIGEACLLHHGDLIQFADVVFRVALRRVQDGAKTMEDNSADRALVLIQFDKLMAEGAVVPYFQPLVALDSRVPVGFEVLGRSRLFGLSEPKAMFGAAAVLNSQAELSRMFRAAGVREGRQLLGSPNLFLNTHPVELVETELLELSLREIREMRPNGPMTLEIHEAAATEPCTIARLRSLLQDFDIGLAYDDFGAGQARLLELAEASPDYLKFDIKLIQGIDHAPIHRVKLIENLVRLALDMGVIPVAEGIEVQPEHEVCQQIGFAIGQGFFYGKAKAAAHYVGFALP